MIARRILLPALTCLILAGVVIGVVFIPPYVCGWLPPYSSPLECAGYYWSPKAQFLRCNAILHEIDAAKDAYTLEHDIVAPDMPLTSEQLGLSRKGLQQPAFKCPAGGRYTINPPGVHPTCSIHGDSLKWREGQPYPTRNKPAPPLRVPAPGPRQLSPEDRIEVPPPDNGSGID